MRCDARPVVRIARWPMAWRWALRRTAAGLIFGLTGGCAAVHRPPATVASIAASADAARVAEQAARDTIVTRLARRAAARGDRTVDLLLLSGGGQHGAYGVGFLRGWRARAAGAPGASPMPRFDLVTGVSTGALQAPFALLGTDAALDTLAALYRTAATSFAPKFDPWFWLRRTGGVVNTKRYEATIARIVDARFGDALAAEFRADRQLVVATTDFDLGTGRAWDLQTAFAADGGGEAGRARARALLYTSSAIPGIFPPRVLDGHVHADGGVIANALAPLGVGDYRALAAAAGGTEAAPVTVRVWLVLNLWTHAAPAVLDPARRRAMSRRTNGLLLFAQQPPLAARLAELADLVTATVPGLRVEFHYTAPPAELATEPGAAKLFDQAWMRRLEALGYARAQGAAPWDTAVSAYARPRPVAGTPAAPGPRTASADGLVAPAGAGATADSVRGTATYRERIALPDDAVFEATLEDVSRADAASVVLGRTRRARPGQPPFRFAIAYDAAALDPRHTYAVRARVTLGERLLFTTTDVVPVLTRGHGREAALILRAAGR